jgi:hypothetical protein
MRPLPHAMPSSPACIRCAARSIWLGLLAFFATVTLASTPAAAQQQQAKPNILFIMGDDIGWMQPSIYHRGLII